MTAAVEAPSNPAKVRVWEREAIVSSDGTLQLPLRFRVVPDTWPNIRLASPEGTPSDVTAQAHEVRVRFEPGLDNRLDVEIGGANVSFVGRTARTSSGEVIAPGAGPIDLTLLIEDGAAQLVLDGSPMLTLDTGEGRGDQGVAAVSENIEGFRVASPVASFATVTAPDRAVLLDARVFGLRERRSPLHHRTSATTSAGETFYQSTTYVVADGVVIDDTDLGEPALVPDRMTIVSPIRVVEEFRWRDTGRGDMIRVADRTEMWRSHVEPSRYPRLETRFRSVDAAFELAMETFQRNTDGEFSLPGQTGLWSAGFFQGPGEGFGSWRRDTSHIALRSGNLLDPSGARSSLASAAAGAFDNGSDGDVLPAVAVWDYYLATGDKTLLEQLWPALHSAAARLDARFDPHRHLIHAPHSTSNDLFDELDSGGYALSTEVYAARSYEALADIAEVLERGTSNRVAWRQRADTMKRTILDQYWNPERGYFTSGPRGTPAFDQGTWETSGAEAILWDRTDAADGKSRVTLRAVHEVAMSDYGIVLFPNRAADDHFANSVWYCWQAGIARAAARAGDANLVHTLIGQQVRTVVRNKTFYEVTDAHTGASWRWPGQLWHAAGFASLLLFGALGITYDRSGMRFSPAIVPELDGLRLTNLKYRQSVLDVEVRGHGTRFTLEVDGSPAEAISPSLTNHHSATLTARG